MSQGAADLASANKSDFVTRHGLGPYRLASPSRLKYAGPIMGSASGRVLGASLTRTSIGRNPGGWGIWRPEFLFRARRERFFCEKPFVIPNVYYSICNFRRSHHQFKYVPYNLHFLLFV